MASLKDNNVMKFTDYDVFGFDMDFTLARYELVPFFELAYGCICKFLAKKKSYDASIFKGFHEIKYLVCAGLFVDYEKGNILKLDENGAIIRGVHGTRQLTDHEITAGYGKKKIFPHLSQFSNKTGIKSSDKSWRFHENLFDLPGMAAYAEIVDFLETKAVKPTSSQFLQAASDLLDAYEHLYVPTQFAKNKGGYFPGLKSNTTKYIDRISDNVRAWLENMRKDGRKLFFLTTSFPDYANHVMNVVLGPKWKTYFDLVLYGARKPKFFTESKPFIHIVDCQPMEEVGKLEAGKEYCHGNFVVLNMFLQQITGKAKPKVVYFGDNVVSDACPSTLLAKWDSVLVLEEMDAEGYAVTDGTVPGHEDELEDPGVAPAKRKRKYEHSSLITNEEIELMASSFWGSIFIENSTKDKDDDNKTMNTLYGSLISKHASICVPSIEYLSGIPLDHEFSTFSSQSCCARGFHPGRPRSLLPQ